jgi:hypothetical protein
MTNVVGLRGREVVDPRKPHPDVIGIAKEFLEFATSGEITSVAIIFEFHDGSTGARRGGTPSYLLLGRLAGELEYLAKHLRENP